MINQTHYLITVKKEKTTSDAFKSRIATIINLAVEVVRDEKSKLIYHSSFNNLSTQQQHNMRRVVEKCVIEYI
ncbi:MAG: hypothetical protein WDZ35_14665 [Crocinitomicaceae bacterium]